MKFNNIEELEAKLIEANNSYRVGLPIISDKDYDRLLEMLHSLDPNNKFLFEIGYNVSTDRKTKLPIPMYSMDKIKTIDEMKDWLVSNNIIDEYLILTPKYDGLSLCVDEEFNRAYTRGDGEYGQKSDEHYSLMMNKLDKNGSEVKYTYGEVIIPKETFNVKYSNDFSNPRNLVSGILNSKTTTKSLNDCYYIKYGAVDTKFKTKEDLLNELNNRQSVKVDFIKVKFSDLNDEYLLDLFKKWSEVFEIDGIIIEVNNIDKQESLGRERSNNPKYARAYKSPLFEKSIEANVIDLTYQISKHGLLKPVINIEPVELEGVIISNITGNNARFIKENGIGKGSIIRIVRSGMVIPKVIEVLKSVEFELPNIPNITWNENGVELITMDETTEQRIKKNIAFFEILGAENISSGIINQLWSAGYKTIKDILYLSVSDLRKLDKFGDRKAEIVYNSIQSCIKNVPLSKLQHASSIFKGLGSRKLAMLEHFTSKPTIEDVLQIDGFADISASEYINNYDKFYDFISELPITIKEYDPNAIANSDSDLAGKIFVFTGVRRKDLVKIIESRGGKEGSSISSKTTHLICLDKSSSSSKMNKAIELGITIMDVNELESFLNN